MDGRVCSRSVTYLRFPLVIASLRSPTQDLFPERISFRRGFEKNWAIIENGS